MIIEKIKQVHKNSFRYSQAVKAGNETIWSHNCFTLSYIILGMLYKY